MASRQQRRIERDMERALEREVRRGVDILTATLRTDTPKDTGLASSSWIPSIGSPSSVRPVSTGVAAAAQAGGLAAAGAWRFADRDPYITNNVEYIGLLDGGSSSQAAAGFVLRAGIKTVTALETRAR